jgi:transposase
MLSHLRLSDALWGRIAPHLPAPPAYDLTVGGRPRVDDRSALNGILFVLFSGIGWQQLPVAMGCGSGSTCWRRLHDWQAAGVWDTVLDLLLADLVQQERLDMANLLVDGSKVPAKKGGPVSAIIPQIAGVPGSNGTS